MHAVVRDMLASLPCPTVAAAPWEDLWTRHPAAWRGLVALYLRRTAASDAEVSESESDDDGEFLCFVCGSTFKSVPALTTHRARVHGYRNPFSIRVEGSSCLRCGIDFRTRTRLIAHLGKVHECGCLALEFPVLSPEAQAAADAGDAALTRVALRAGQHPRAGPPALRP